MMKNKQFLGHLATFGTYLIFGFNIIICKELTTSALFSPMTLSFLRCIFCAALVWPLSLLFPKKGTQWQGKPVREVPAKDLVAIFFASIFGLVLPQFTFLQGITHASPLDCSLLVVLTPIFTMFIAAIVLKEPITLKKAGGVAVSCVGVIILILNSVRLQSGTTQTDPIGITLLVLNALFFAMYLGIFRPLVSRYHPITFMKWMFLFASVVLFPFSIKELTTINYVSIPTSYYLELGYLVFCATFLAYLFLPVGQKNLRPTVVSLYTYLQPMIASIASICLGMDTLTWQKSLAAIAIVCGVVLVNQSKAREVQS